MKKPLTLLVEHVDECQECCWITGSFCQVARMLEASAMRWAGQLDEAIPTIQIGKVKAQA